MMKVVRDSVVLVLLASLVAMPAMAKKPRKGRGLKPGDPNPKITAIVKALMDGFTFGMTKQEVYKKVRALVKKSYITRMRKAKTRTERDRLMKEMKEALKELKKNVVDFKGQQSGWDTSIVDDQFAHNNNESMIVYKKDKETYYFFFYQDRLYKIFIALDKQKFMGWSFAKFQIEMEKKFGPAKEVYRKDASGEEILHHLMWRSPEGIELWAMDKTTVYGTFVFVVVDAAVNAEVEQTRKDNGTLPPGEKELQDSDPVIDSIMQ